MIATIPPGDQKRTHIVGRSQGYLGLPVHYCTVIDGPSGQETPCLRTAHQPTPEEIADIVAGAPIILELINITTHPPMLIKVGARPEI